MNHKEISANEIGKVIDKTLNKFHKNTTKFY